jgi:cupin 2 domain-containing protein
MEKESLLAGLSQEHSKEFSEEFIKEVFSTNAFRIEKIISKGHSSPEDFWYDQQENEWVLLVKGAGKLEFEGGEIIQLGVGDYVYIPAHKKHRVSWTAPEEETVWLAIFYT